MARVFVYPYKAGSQSAKALATALGAKCIKLENSRYVSKPTDYIINWGASNLNFIPQRFMGMTARLLNNPGDVARCTNKLDFFYGIKEHNRVVDHLDVDEDINIPEFTTDIAVAEQWLNEGHNILERHKLTGHSGEGIVFSNTPDVVGEAPLYVKYIPKKEEFRVHIVNGEVIHIQRKARKQDVPDEEVNWQVRNLDGGFIYQINDIEVPECVTDQALRAFNAIGLNFGAVDVIWNKRHDQAYVLEINTAPGLVGTTLGKYVEAFTKLIGE
jgi:glutathione synthase/RimK-type ligase-like ATP-grasp enzyme